MNPLTLASSNTLARGAAAADSAAAAAAGFATDSFSLSSRLSWACTAARRHRVAADQPNHNRHGDTKIVPHLQPAPLCMQRREPVAERRHIRAQPIGLALGRLAEFVLRGVRNLQNRGFTDGARH